MLVKSEDLICQRYVASISSIPDRYSCDIVCSERVCDMRCIPEDRSRSGGDLVHHFGMILQVHFSCQCSVALGMGTCY